MRCRLGDIVATNRNTYSPKDEWIYVNYLDTGSIVSNIITNVEYIDLKTNTLPSRAKRKVQVNSIIYSTVRPNQLHYGIVKTPYQNFLVSTGFVVIDVDNNKADADYVYYLLTQKATVAYLQNIAEQSVSAYPSIKPSDIEDIEIYLPDLTTQKQVSTLLRTFDEKMNLLSQINHNLEEQAKAIFKSWFIDYGEYNGKIPKTWQQGVLGDFIEIKRGSSPRPIQNYLSDKGLRWLKISDATSISSPFISRIKEFIKEDGLKQTVFLKAGSLILSNSATPGVPKILDIDACIHDGWLYFPKSVFSNEYLYLYFKHIREKLLRLGNGSVFTNLKIDILKNYETILPTDEVLNKFNTYVKPVFAQIRKNTAEISTLTTLRDTLLPKLMSGEIDVSAVEIGR